MIRVSFDVPTVNVFLDHSAATVIETVTTIATNSTALLVSKDILD